ncbi:MAG: hypothetical protein HYV29_01720 [Ignavibacteriales bacterium]|nr:hypothetical protein [Ignavibacteriales bacterium]
MSEIEKQKEREFKYYELLGLLKKIYQHNSPVKIEINFDGTKFASWAVFAPNLTAEDWNPTKRTNGVPEGISIQTQTKFVHRKKNH